jgi:hypothetical protein
LWSVGLRLELTLCKDNRVPHGERLLEERGAGISCATQ